MCWFLGRMCALMALCANAACQNMFVRFRTRLRLGSLKLLCVVVTPMCLEFAANLRRLLRTVTSRRHLRRLLRAVASRRQHQIAQCMEFAAIDLVSQRTARFEQ